MTVAVTTVRPNTLVGVAAALLTGQGIASLPVVDDDDRLVGIVSEMDLISDRMPDDDRFGLPRSGPEDVDPAREVRAVMTTAVVCIAPARTRPLSPPS